MLVHEVADHPIAFTFIGYFDGHAPLAAATTETKVNEKTKWRRAVFQTDTFPEDICPMSTFPQISVNLI